MSKASAVIECGGDRSAERFQDPFEQLEQRVNERTAEIEARTRQQAAVAALGHLALKNTPLRKLLRRATNLVSSTFNVDHCYVLTAIPDTNQLLLIAGVGWKRGMVGKATIRRDSSTQAGATLESGGPIVVEDFDTQSRFARSLLLLEHEVKSGLTVAIHGQSEPFGVLGVHSRQRRTFTEDDANFLEAIANVLSTAIDRDRAERVARHRTATLIKTINALTTTPNLDLFLGQVLSSLSEFLECNSATLWFYELADYSLSLHMVYHEGSVVPGEKLKRPLQDYFILPEGVPFWDAMASGQRPLVLDIASTTGNPYFEWLQSRGYRYVLIVPMLVGDEAIGWFGFRSAEQRTYRPDELEFAQALAQQATLAVRLTRLAEQGQRAAVLQERTRLAQEIHDTLAQGLTGILVQMSAAESAPSDRPEATKSHIARAREIAKESLAEARRSVQALRPISLEGESLSDALARLAERMTAGTSIHTKFEVHGAPHVLAPDTENNLLRVGMEALTNAVRHSGADEICITLTFETGQTRLCVRDNGSGFVNLEEMSDGHFGLIGMRERMARIGGEITLSNHPQGGAEVIALSPANTPRRGKVSR